MCRNPTAGETAEIFLQKKPMLNLKKTPNQPRKKQHLPAEVKKKKKKQ